MAAQRQPAVRRLRAAAARWLSRCPARIMAGREWIELPLSLDRDRPVQSTWLFQAPTTQKIFARPARAGGRLDEGSPGWTKDEGLCLAFWVFWVSLAGIFAADAATRGIFQWKCQAKCQTKSLITLELESSFWNLLCCTEERWRTAKDKSRSWILIRTGRKLSEAAGSSTSLTTLLAFLPTNQQALIRSIDQNLHLIHQTYVLTQQVFSLQLTRSNLDVSYGTEKEHNKCPSPLQLACILLLARMANQRTDKFSQFFFWRSIWWKYLCFPVPWCPFKVFMALCYGVKLEVHTIEKCKVNVLLAYIVPILHHALYILNEKTERNSGKWNLSINSPKYLESSFCPKNMILSFPLKDF